MLQPDTQTGDRQRPRLPSEWPILWWHPTLVTARQRLPEGYNVQEYSLARKWKYYCEGGVTWAHWRAAACYRVRLPWYTSRRQETAQNCAEWENLQICSLGLHSSDSRLESSLQTVDLRVEPLVKWLILNLNISQPKHWMHSFEGTIKMPFKYLIRPKPRKWYIDEMSSLMDPSNRLSLSDMIMSNKL